MRPAFQNKLTLSEVRDELRSLGKGNTEHTGGGLGAFGELDRQDGDATSSVGAPAKGGGFGGIDIL